MRRDDPATIPVWQDTGCRYWSKCVSCPLPACVEEWRNPEEGFTAQRDAVIRRLFASGYPAVFLAQEFNLSRRAVYHALGRVLEEQAS